MRSTSLDRAVQRMRDFMIFDAHLDLAMNQLRGRDITHPASTQPVVDNEIATVGLPDLRQGQVTRICGTIFCQPQTDRHPGYRSIDEAYEQAAQQIGWYQLWISQGELGFADRPGTPQVNLLIEGADCIRKPDDLYWFYEQGVRIVGLAWQATRFAGGTACPGPITPDGQELIRELDQLEMIHDLSHLSEESFWDLLDLASGPVIASHSNCRSIVQNDPNQRHLSDDMIRAIIQKKGVIGINFYDRFLLPADQYGKRRATLRDVVNHIRHICDLAGNPNHVGLGTDMDGGLGREQVPIEIRTSADLTLLYDALTESGFPDAAVRGVLFDNWARVIG